MDDGKFRYALMVLFMFPWSLCGWMTVIVTPSCVDSFLCYRSNYLAISSILFFFQMGCAYHGSSDPRGIFFYHCLEKKRIC